MKQNLEFTTGGCPNISVRIVVTFFFSLCLLVIHFTVDPWGELIASSLWNQKGNISNQPPHFFNRVPLVHIDVHILQSFSSA